MMSSEFPHIEWRTTSSTKGVTLREHGEGEAVFIFPGMEGSGESCLHLAVPVIQQTALRSQSYRIVLVDYALEEHWTMERLIDTMHKLISRAAGDDLCVFWGQSFGNLLATGVSKLGGINVRKFVLVSPFTALPQMKAHIGTLLLYITPTFLYRATIGPLGRYTFGPVGDQRDHPFFNALCRGTSGVARRRTAWLRCRKFSTRFAETPAPTKVWLGKQDRLVNLKQQQAFFAKLSHNRSDYMLSMIDGSGHVVLPTNIVQTVRAELLQWLTEGK